MEPSDTETVGRRTVLRTVGSAIVAGIGASATAAGSQQEHEPVRVSGTRKLRISCEDSAADSFCELRKRFIPGNDGATEFGDDGIDLGTDKIKRRVMEEVIESAKRNPSVSVETTQASEVVIQYADTALIGTIEQHYEHEKQILNTQISPLNDLIVPLYVYDGDDPSSFSDLAEATGPINVAWTNGMTASEIDSEVNWGEHAASLFAGDRYIIDGSSVKSQDEDLTQNILPKFQPNQYHGRLYDLSNHSGDVAAQFHRDPSDHGLARDEVNWRFSESRAHASEDWSDVNTLDYDNGGQFGSSNGKLDLIDGDWDGGCTLWDPITGVCVID